MIQDKPGGSEIRVGLFVKVPQPGRVKTRLGAVVGMRSAAKFYAACVGWMLERLRRRSIRHDVFFTPSDGEHRLRSLYDLTGVHELHPQKGEDLGTRMYNALVTLSADDRAKPLILGSDVPDVPLSRVDRAGRLLTENDLVLGPSQDGGYYLIGVNNPRPVLFEGIEWGQSTVLKETLRRAREEGLEYARLDPWNDLDRLEDFDRYHQ